jgi:uncharacterized small protein (DUF1192 family)
LHQVAPVQAGRRDLDQNVLRPRLWHRDFTDDGAGFALASAGDDGFHCSGYGGHGGRPLEEEGTKGFNSTAQTERVLAMAWDDLDPKTKKAVPLDLGPLSIEDLQARIQEFQSEIGRMEEAIRLKLAQRSSADALFRKT